MGTRLTSEHWKIRQDTGKYHCPTCRTNNWARLYVEDTYVCLTCHSEDQIQEQARENSND